MATFQESVFTVYCLYDKLHATALSICVCMAVRGENSLGARLDSQGWIFLHQRTKKEHIFTPILGEMIQIDNIFQMGWNHHLEIVGIITKSRCGRCFPRCWCQAANIRFWVLTGDKTETAVCCLEPRNRFKRFKALDHQGPHRRQEMLCLFFDIFCAVTGSVFRTPLWLVFPVSFA